MFKILDGSQGDVVGVEISQAYTTEDVDQLIKIFEEKIAAGNPRLNVLIKIDQLDLKNIQPAAFIKDAKYALQHIDQLRHIAVVGDSELERVLIELDNKIFGDEKKELIEKYFDVSEMDKAWEFVRG